jgi:hypothetical protein
MFSMQALGAMALILHMTNYLYILHSKLFLNVKSFKEFLPSVPCLITTRHFKIEIPLEKLL